MLPVAEQSIVLRALHPVPQNRWSSCGDLMRHLSNVVYEKAVQAGQPATSKKSGRYLRPHVPTHS